MVSVTQQLKMEISVLFVLPLLALISAVLCTSEHAVPLIGWSSTRSLADKPRIAAGKVVTKDELDANYIASILQTQPQNIFLFVFDELSIDDITLYSDAYNAGGNGGALSHLKKAMVESASNLVLPAVEPTDLQHDLSSKVNGAVIDLQEPTLKGVHLDPAKTNLIITHLGVTTGESREDDFRKADQAIDSILQGQHTHYTAIMTAKHKSLPQPLKRDRVNIGRHLLQTVQTSFVANYKNEYCNMYMTANSISLILKYDESKPETLELPTNYDDWAVNGSCVKDGDTFNLHMSLKNTTAVEGLYNFTLSLVFKLSVFNYWNVVSGTESDPVSFAMITEQGGDAVTYYMDTGITDTPGGFSYHCSDGVFQLVAEDDVTHKTSALLKFNELQIQPYGITSKKTSKGQEDQYGPANDCVGFFSEGILMGLFMAFIMLLILFCSLSMVFNLRVMDKFDDPKGKTITVNVATE